MPSRARDLVLDVDGTAPVLWCVSPLGGLLQLDTAAELGPAGVRGGLLSLDFVVSALSSALKGSPEVTLIVTPRVMKAWGLPEQQPGYRDHVPGLDTSARFKHGELSAPWITYRPVGGGRIRVHVGLWGWMAGKPKDHPLFEDLLTGPDATDPGTSAIRAVCARLSRWRALTGLPYRGIPGIASTALLRTVVDAQKARSPLWHQTLDDVMPHEPELNWTAPANGPAQQPYDQYGRTLPGSVVLDRVRAYLAAAQSVEVAGDGLEEGPAAFDHRLAGWWLISAGRWPHPHLMPDPLHRHGGLVHERPLWVTTPTLRWWNDLTDNGDATGYEVRRSLVGHPRRIFRVWAEGLDKIIRAQSHQYDATGDANSRTLAAAAKAGYRQLIGLLNREGGAIERSDWHYAIVAQARTTVERQGWTVGQATGRWPTSIRTDALGYRGKTPPEGLKVTDPAIDGTAGKLGTYRIKEQRA